MKHQRPLLCRNFLFQYHLGSRSLSQEWKLCVNSLANTVARVPIAQSTTARVPELFQGLREETRDWDTYSGPA